MRRLCCGQKSLFRENCTCLQEREGADRKSVGRGRRGGREEKGRMKVIRKEKKEKERQEKGKEWGRRRRRSLGSEERQRM